uniref:Root cap n=1 Tax=Chenopodium quinoa TaxID=63459 RepID=A0A803KTU4_CHEQI
MAPSKMFYLGCLVLVLAIAVEAASTPPGIAKNPSRASSSSAASSAAEGSSSSGGSPQNSHHSSSSHNSSSTPSNYYPTPSTPSPKPSTPTKPSPSTPNTPTTPSTPSSPPTSNVDSRKRAKCRNKNYGQCYNQVHVCPANCPTSCQVDCVTCKPVCNCDYPGAVCQDPRFIGGDGITFYFHGKKDQQFCLVSDPNLHINAHFIGKRNENMGRDFTWVQSIGILFDNHRLFLGARKTSTWDDANDRLSLAFDGEPIFLEETLGSQWSSTSMPQVTITRASETNDIVVEIQGKLKITAKVVPITDEESRVHNYGITNEDRFAHLDLGFKFYSLTGKVDGVLGKTYRDDYVSRVNMRASMPVMGGEREFASSSIFATDCLASRFVGSQEETSLETMDLASMNCASGMNGRGVVCKR